MRRFVFVWVFINGCWGAAFTQQKIGLPSKLSPALTQLSGNAKRDSADVILALKKDPDFTLSRFAGHCILHRYHNTVTIRMPRKAIASLAADTAVVFADVVKIPREELTTGRLDLAVNKLNAAHARFPQINGQGILASVKEQRPDTTDIDYRNRYVNTGAAAATATAHASAMATTLAGGGNSSPAARGAAPAARITSTSFASLLPESDAYYQLFQIPIQNHSYGTTPENYYGVEAAAYDQSVQANPTLVHVFSSGNAGTTTGTGPYAGLQGWSNLTGNFKTAKNVIAVGAVDSFYNVAAASSRGPAFDGRIKPELVAFGEDGSSGAAALASGTVALVQQAYQLTKNRLPAAALVKAVLINSADAINQRPVGHATGWGSLNGYEAVKTVQEARYQEDSLQHGGLKKFVLTVPANAAKLKITLAWTDIPAVPNTPKALVNDLDVVLKNGATGKTWLPWVLNASSHIDSLMKGAVRQRDTVNNVEQITVDVPASGDYVLEISGSKVTGVQAYAIAYQVDTTDYFEWTFPTSNDGIAATEATVLRWQTTHAGTGDLEYTTNHQEWQPIADMVNLSRGYYQWATPDTLTTAQLRMRFANGTQAISDTFVISKTLNLQTGFYCEDSALLYWNHLEAARYLVYNLDSFYLQPVHSTSDTQVVFNTGIHHSTSYSVAPLVNGKAGLRSYTINVAAPGAGCYFRSFYVQTQDDKQAAFTALLGTTYNIASLSFQKERNYNFVTLRTISQPTATQFLFADSNLTQGANRYRLQITLRNGTTLTSNEVRVFHFPDALVFIYPNPALRGQRITLLTNAGSAVTISIYDAAGRQVQQVRPSVGNRLPTITLPPGMYFIHVVEAGGRRRTQKLAVY